MPYRRRTRRKRRTRRRANKSSTVRLYKSPTPDSMIVKMKYGSVVKIQPGIGLSATHVFSANSIFDPDRTAVGHQPLGHDEYAIFYNHATVLGSRIKVRFVPTSAASATGNALVSIALQADDTASAIITTQMIERSGVNWRVMGTSYANAGNCVLTKNFSAKRFFGVDDVKDNTNLRGTFGANPADQAYYHVSAAPTELAASASEVDCIVEIEYIALLSERKALLSS